ncbi:MAG: hypothetical protein ACYDEN_12350, partial [Acidimicrobiales bacterium]
MGTASAAVSSRCDTWTGAVSQDWATAGNWSAGVPGGRRRACIPAGPAGSAPVVAGAARAAAVHVGRGSQLTVMPGGRLE